MRSVAWKAVDAAKDAKVGDANAMASSCSKSDDISVADEATKLPPSHQNLAGLGMEPPARLNRSSSARSPRCLFQSWKSRRSCALRQLPDLGAIVGLWAEEMSSHSTGGARSAKEHCTTTSTAPGTSEAHCPTPRSFSACLASGHSHHSASRATRGPNRGHNITRCSGGVTCLKH